jgi:carboxymethylenebutenolidase
MLALFGREDKNPSPADVEMLREQLVNERKTFEIVSYKNAGHAFLSDTRDTFRPEAANAAWGRIIEWFANYLKP